MQNCYILILKLQANATEMNFFNGDKKDKKFLLSSNFMFQFDDDDDDFQA